MRELVLFKCLFYLFKLLGLCTVKINTVSLRNEKKIFFTHCKIDLIYNVSLITLVIIVEYFYHSILCNISNVLKQESQFALFQNDVITVLCILIIFLFCVKQKNFILLICGISFMQKSLANLDKKIFLDENKSMIRKIICFFTLNAVTFVIPLISMGKYSHRWILKIVIIFFKEMIINYSLVQYITLVMFINTHFRIINKNFHKILSTYFDTVEEKLVYFSRLHDYYFTLRKLVKKVSDFYNFSLFFSVVFLCITAVFEGYYLSGAILDNSTLFFHHLSRIFYCLFLLVVLTKSMTELSSEVNNLQVKIKPWLLFIDQPLIDFFLY